MFKFSLSLAKKQFRRSSNIKGNNLKINVKNPIELKRKIIFKLGKRKKVFTVKYNGYPTKKEKEEIIKKLAVKSYSFGSKSVGVAGVGTITCRSVKWEDVIVGGKKVGRTCVEEECSVIV